MKTKSVTLAALAVSQLITLAAFAQSSSTTETMPSGPGAAAAPAGGDASSAPAANTAGVAGTSVAEAPAKPKLNISYLGIMYGPGLSNELDGKTYGGDVQYLNNRPAIKYNFNDNLDLGVQARFNIRFQSDGMDAVNDPWRVFSNIKNIYKDDVLQFNVLARAILPTRLKDHNARMLPSPELLPILNITPKNSRFSLSVYPQLIRYFYTDAATSANSGRDVALGNFEGTYQLTGSTAVTFGFYPEWVSTNSRGLFNDSNELDLGVSFDVVKGWAVNPFVAAEFVGMGANGASASKNMALNMVITGSLL
jgi:hypothetical protein